MRIASALLAVLLTLPMAGWLLLPGLGAAGASSPSAPDACARACATMAGMHGMACPLMKQTRRDQACSCQISGVPHLPALAPVCAVAPDSPSRLFSFRMEIRRVAVLTLASPCAGFPGRIDHPPSVSC